MTLLVTGGAGFIGSNFVLDWLAHNDEPVVNVDALTYAGNRANLAALDGDPRHHFVHGDICDRALLERLFAEHRPRAVIHLAAESHVDRSIDNPGAFLRTNVDGTFALLEAARVWLTTQPDAVRNAFRFVHVSTDEVYGALEPHARPFTERHPCLPNSPYSASKAASDHLVRAWHHTWKLPTLITRCSNNYGPFQFPEKLIPLLLIRALRGETLPLYGDGRQVRDWLYVGDHCAALRAVLAHGEPGETYNIGGWNELRNVDLLEQLCALLDARRPDPGGPYARLLRHVADRPGHDRRYAIDARKIATELGWKPRHTFTSGLARTVDWYLAHPQWLADIERGEYRHWMDRHYAVKPGAAGEH